MKKFLALLLLPVFSFGQTDVKRDFSITGNIKGLPDSTMVFLSRPGQTSEVLAVDYSQKGKFNLFGKVADGDIYQIN